MIESCIESPSNTIEKYFMEKLNVPQDIKLESFMNAIDFDDSTDKLNLVYWLTNAIKSTNDYFEEQNKFLLIIGPEEIGKIDLCNWLIPRKIKQYFNMSYKIRLSNKDETSILKKCWIIAITNLSNKYNQIEKLCKYIKYNHLRPNIIGVLDKNNLQKTSKDYKNVINYVYPIGINHIDWEQLSGKNPDGIWIDVINNIVM